jgi:hypothetical protein
VRLTVVPRVVLHLQNQTVRLPIGVIDTQVLSRYLSAVSVLRLPLERVLGSLHAAAGRLLDDQPSQQGGAALRQPATLTRTAQLEHNPQRRHGQAEQQLTAAPGPANRRAWAQCDYHDDAAAARGDEQAAMRRVAEQAQARAAAEKDRAEAAARWLRHVVNAQRGTGRAREPAAARLKAALKVA